MLTDTDDGIREYVGYDGDKVNPADDETVDGGAETTSRLKVDEFASDDTREAARESLPPSDDPVRMYLKEIGQVPLLDSNREMWLSVQIAAERHLESLRDELMSLDKQLDNRREANHLDVERFAYKRLKEDWDKLLDVAGAQAVDAPDFIKALAEVEETIVNWDREADSYIRGYLKQRNWGRDEKWTVLAQAFFQVIHALFLFPFEHQMQLQRYFPPRACLADVVGIRRLD